MLVERVRAGIAGGVNVVQLREKGLPAGDLFGLAWYLRRVTQGRALLIVNDRVDVALAVGADGAHLPENGLPIESAQQMLGENMLLGWFGAQRRRRRPARGPRCRLRASRNTLCDGPPSRDAHPRGHNWCAT